MLDFSGVFLFFDPIALECRKLFVFFGIFPAGLREIVTVTEKIQISQHFVSFRNQN